MAEEKRRDAADCRALRPASRQAGGEAGHGNVAMGLPAHPNYTACCGAGDAAAASISRVTLRLRLSAAATIRAQYSAGMLSRCRHLRTEASLASTSEARTSSEGQRSMMVLKEGEASIGRTLRQFVLNCNPELCHEFWDDLSQDLGVSKVTPPSDFHCEFIARTTLARETAGYTQQEISTILGIPQTTYKWYETRSLLPHRLIPAFCVATRVGVDWLFMGKGPRRARPSGEPEPKSETNGKAARRPLRTAE